MRAPATAATQALSADFYDRPVLEVARDLIGCTVEHAGTSGVIVETEAYHDSEPASHAFIGLTPRTRTLFGEPGRAYVYRSYGIHALLNAVCEPEGVGAAVLIRALEPLSGIETMRRRRRLMRIEDLCSGPGKLTQALGVSLQENGELSDERPCAHRPAPAGMARPRCDRGYADRDHQGGRPALALLRGWQPPCLAPPATARRRARLGCGAAARGRGRRRRRRCGGRRGGCAGSFLSRRLCRRRR